MKNRFDNAIQFKNGNIHIKFDHDTLDRINDNNHYPYNDDRFELNESLFAVDSFILNNQYFVGCECFQTIYNANTDKYYTLRLSDIEKYLLNGKTLILYARDPIDDEIDWKNQQF